MSGTAFSVKEFPDKTDKLGRWTEIFGHY